MFRISDMSHETSVKCSNFVDQCLNKMTKIQSFRKNYLVDDNRSQEFYFCSMKCLRNFEKIGKPRLVNAERVTEAGMGSQAWHGVGGGGCQ